MDKFFKNWTRNYTLSFMATYVPALAETAKKFFGFSIESATAWGYQCKDMALMSMKDKNKFDKYLTKTFLTKWDGFKKYLNFYEKKKKELTVKAKKINSLDLVDFSNRQLAELYEEFEGINRQFMIIGQFTGYELNHIMPDILKEKLMKARVELFEIDRILNIILTPFDERVISKMEKELLVIADKIEKKKLSKDKIENSIKRLVEEYGWLPSMTVDMPLWDEAYFENRFKEIRAAGDIKEQKAIMAKAKKEADKKKKELDKLLVDYSKFKDLFKITNKLSCLKDERDEARRYCYFLSRPLYHEMAKRLGVGIDKLVVMAPYEIVEVLRGERAMIDDKEIARRNKSYILRCVSGKLKVYSGEEAINFSKKYFNKEDKSKDSEIKGTVASKGLAKGKVKVVLGKQDLLKINKGDVLVAITTHPDYVPAMKKSVAIVTDEGGLTCHAAIVSRELGIPCITATGKATEVFKDGDIVEVNADKGIVILIK